MQPTANTSSINNIAFRILAEQTDLVVFVKDRNGRFTFINEAGKRLFGLNLNEIIGKNEIDLLGPSIGFES